ncbi:MAG: hypothetical protein WCJ40_09980 [Planctomycetota bacterium]
MQARNDRQAMQYDLSVLITPTKSGGSLSKLAASLLRHFKATHSIQIVVVVPEKQRNDSLYKHLKELKSEVASLTLIPVDEDQKSDVPHWRALAFQASRGRIAVFLEDNAVIEPGWWEAWQNCCNTNDWTIASGLVRPDSERLSRTESAVFFCEYGLFLPTSTGRKIKPLHRVAGNHWAVNRQKVSVGNQIESIDEHDWVHQFTSRAQLPFWNENAIVKCNRQIGLKEALAERAMQGFRYGRGESIKSGWFRRLKMIHAGIAITGIQLARLFRVVAQRRMELRLWIRALPLTIAMIHTWSLAEWAGWCMGAVAVVFHRNLQDRTKKASEIPNASVPANAMVVKFDEPTNITVPNPHFSGVNREVHGVVTSQRYYD